MSRPATIADVNAAVERLMPSETSRSSVMALHRSIIVGIARDFLTPPASFPDCAEAVAMSRSGCYTAYAAWGEMPESQRLAWCEAVSANMACGIDPLSPLRPPVSGNALAGV